MSELMKPAKERAMWRDMVYPPGQEPFAIPNGTLVRKINSEVDDMVPDGLIGVVLASHNVTYDTAIPEGDKAYIVEWGWWKGLPVVMSSHQIERAD